MEQQPLSNEERARALALARTLLDPHDRSPLGAAMDLTHEYPDKEHAEIDRTKAGDLDAGASLEDGLVLMARAVVEVADASPLVMTIDPDRLRAITPEMIERLNDGRGARPIVLESEHPFAPPPLNARASLMFANLRYIPREGQGTLTTGTVNVGDLVCVEVPPNCTVHADDAVALAGLLACVKEIAAHWRDQEGVNGTLLDDLAEIVLGARAPKVHERCGKCKHPYGSHTAGRRGQCNGDGCLCSGFEEAEAGPKRIGRLLRTMRVAADARTGKVVAPALGMDPDTATGAQLDAIVELTGTPRSPK